MTAVVRVHRVGGPEVLVHEEIDLPAPGPGEVRIRQHACGINFIDTYFRTGLYKVPLPAILGNDGAGVIVAVGADVTDFAPGDRVVCAERFNGYAAERLAPADRVVKLPDAISFEQAAGMMFKGLTAHYLVRSLYSVGPRTTMLVHAAAGGVGLIACQWARHLGARVIGTVGSREKAEMARAHGCHETILYNEENFADRVREITGGALCDVVYDGVGAATFPASLDCLRPRGLFVNYGYASGPIPPFSPTLLLEKGSLFMTKPSLFDYIGTRAELLVAAEELFDVWLAGAVAVPVNRVYHLRDVAEAHRDLESRRTIGASILVP